MCPHGPMDDISLVQHLKERPHRKLLHDHDHEHDGSPHEPHGPHPHPPKPMPWEDLTPGEFSVPLHVILLFHVMVALLEGGIEFRDQCMEMLRKQRMAAGALNRGDGERAWNAVLDGGQVALIRGGIGCCGQCEQNVVQSAHGRRWVLDRDASVSATEKVMFWMRRVSGRNCRQARRGCVDGAVLPCRRGLLRVPPHPAAREVWHRWCVSPAALGLPGQPALVMWQACSVLACQSLYHASAPLLFTAAVSRK